MTRGAPSEAAGGPEHVDAITPYRECPGALR